MPAAPPPQSCRPENPVTEVLILMATRNGARFLPAQLDSIAAQTHPGWRLLVSDDGSQDDTRAIVAAFARRRPPGQVTLLDGPGQGATANFRSLLRRAPAMAGPLAGRAEMARPAARPSPGGSAEYGRAGAGGAGRGRDISGRDGASRRGVGAGADPARPASGPADPAADGRPAGQAAPPCPAPPLPGTEGWPGAWLAFCDQDDVWAPDHLARALAALAPAPALAVYGCRMRICDVGLAPLGLSPRPRRPLGFGNALVQNVLSGNTMVLSPAAAALLWRAEPRTGPVPVHDWWAYQLVTGAGGAALFDDRPGVSYRQHGANVIGANRGLRQLPARLARHLRGDYRRWAEQNSAALQAAAGLLTPDNRAALDAFAAALGASLPARIAGLRRAGVYFQSRRAGAAFWLSVALGVV